MLGATRRPPVTAKRAPDGPPVVQHPRVRVIVVNHNGGVMNLQCLDSLRRVSWPADRLDVVLVDNASTDGVVARVRDGYPEVTVLEAGDNLGFAGGCNLAMRDLGDTDHVALLNNDAVAEPGWLGPLVRAVESDPSVGAASSKVLFADSFLEVEMTTEADRRGRGDGRHLGVRVSGARVGGEDVWRRAQLVDGFWGPEYGRRAEPHYQWSREAAALRVPVKGSADGCQLRLAADRPKRVMLRSGGSSVEVRVDARPAWYDAPLGGTPFDVVNSAGSMIATRGFGGLRGTDRGYLEREDGRYAEPAEVFAWSGASVLLSKAYLSSVGLFDERFFLYYEDTDLSWRGRLRGWRYLYVPDSVVRHVHSATSVEGSRLAVHYGERNRLLTLARNAPPKPAAAAVARHLLVTVAYVRRDVVGPLLRGRAPRPETVLRRVRAFFAFLRLLPPVLGDRRRTRRSRRMSDADVMRWVDRPDC
jgi:GT2 family glycosyltransferase